MQPHQPGSPEGWQQGPQGWPPQAHQHPYPTPAHDPQRVGLAEILVPLALSIFCGVGGFVWGLVRFAQGHSKPGLAAVAVNAAVWVLGIILWVVAVAIIGAAAGTVKAP